MVQVAPRSKPICEGLEIECGDGAEEATQLTPEVHEEEQACKDFIVEEEMGEENQEDQAIDEEPKLLAPNFDRDGEMNLEIDGFGTSELVADGRLDLGVYDTRD